MRARRARGHAGASSHRGPAVVLPAARNGAASREMPPNNRRRNVVTDGALVEECEDGTREGTVRIAAGARPSRATYPARDLRFEYRPEVGQRGGERQIGREGTERFGRGGRGYEEGPRLLAVGVEPLMVEVGGDEIEVVGGRKR